MAKELPGTKQENVLRATVETLTDRIPAGRQDLKAAAANFFAETEPVVRGFCRIPYFRNSLGINEIYSISHSKLMEVFRKTERLPDSKPAPCLLKRILYNELVNQVHRHETRCKYRQPHREEEKPDTEAVTPTELLPADSRCEPEVRMLQEELARDLEEALHRLKPLEQEVLRSLYYEGKSNKAAAEEMQVTPQYVSALKKSGLARLRKLLKAKYPDTDILH